MTNNIIENLNSIETLFNQINGDIEINNIDFNNIINLIDHLVILSNDIAGTSNNSINIDEYNEKLTSALSAFEEKDYMLFNEVLQFDLKPMLDFWKENIN